MSVQLSKVMTKENLAYLLGKLKERKFFGAMGLSKNDFTDDLKSKLEALVAASSVEDLTALFTRVDTLEAHFATDSDAVINKFQEIVAFLAGISSTDTLEGLLADIAAKLATKLEASDIVAITNAEIDAMITA